MNLLGSLQGVLGGSDIGKSAMFVLEKVQGYSGEHGTGIQGLVTAFQKNGMGEVVQSWVSNGANLPVSAEQIKSALGSSVVQEYAQKLGIDGNQAAETLSQVLPKVIDQLTPNGQLPEGGNMMEMGKNLLDGLLKS